VVCFVLISEPVQYTQARAVSTLLYSTRFRRNMLSCLAVMLGHHYGSEDYTLVCRLLTTLVAPPKFEALWMVCVEHRTICSVIQPGFFQYTADEYSPEAHQHTYQFGCCGSAG
jgi:hypothetical protein